MNKEYLRLLKKGGLPSEKIQGNQNGYSIPYNSCYHLIWIYLFYPNISFFPFAVPAPISKEQGFTYKWFQRPVTVEVMTDDSTSDTFVRCFYFPADKTQYEKLARKLAGFYANILLEGYKVPFDSQEVQTLNMTGIRYNIHLRCAGIVMLKMDFTDGNEIIQMSNDFYTITPELRDELLDYVKKTYTIKKIVT